MNEIFERYKLPDEDNYLQIEDVEEVLEYSPKSRKIATYLALFGYHKLYLGLSKNIFGTLNTFGRLEDYYRLKNGEEFYDGEGRLLR